MHRRTPQGRGGSWALPPRRDSVPLTGHGTDIITARGRAASGKRVPVFTWATACLVVIGSASLSCNATFGSSPDANFEVRAISRDPDPVLTEFVLARRQPDVASPSAEEMSRPGPIAREPALDGARQLFEGYWLGAMIGPERVRALRDLGVRVVISAVRPEAGTAEALAEAGIEHLLIPMGNRFHSADDILDAVRRHRPDQVFIHCRHGADRTGAIAAFLLVVEHGWPIPEALYSVVYRSNPDVSGLANHLAVRGFQDVRAPDDPSVGFYSLAAAGQVGGMKARNAGYVQLVDTAIDAMLAQTHSTL